MGSTVDDFDKYASGSGAAMPAGGVGLGFDFDSTQPSSSNNGSINNFGTGYKYGLESTYNNVKQGALDIASRWNDRIAGSKVGNIAQDITNTLGIKPASTLLQETNQDIQASKASAAPALQTTAGKTGNFLGQTTALAPMAFIPGANTLAGAPLLGATAGYLTTEGSPEDRLKAAAYGAAGGSVGSIVGQGVNKGANLLEDARMQSFAADNVLNAPRNANLALAKANGYKLPPQEVNPGIVNSFLEGVSGKIKTSQAASQANQAVTNNLAKDALGIPREIPITQDVLNNIRQTAGQAYETVRGIGTIPTDSTFNKTLDGLYQKFSNAQKDFPNSQVPDVKGAIDSIRVPQFSGSGAVDQIKILRDNASSAYAQGNTAMGKVNKSLADALEDQIDRHMLMTGADPNAITAFRDARQTIAKTYSVQGALNPSTGNVDAQKLATQLGKGKPLTGELKDIATVGQAFPKATQTLKQDVNPFSPLDALSSMMGYVGKHPLAATVVWGRPLVRGAILSRPAQAINYGSALSNGGMIGNALLSGASSVPARNLLQAGVTQSSINAAK